MVRKNLKAAGIELRSLRDQVVFSGEEVATPEGVPYRVYSPFAKSWSAKFKPEMVAELKPNMDRLAPEESLTPLLQDWSMKTIGPG